MAGVRITKWNTDDVINNSGALGKLLQEHDELRQKVGEDVANKVLTGCTRLLESSGHQIDIHGDKEAVTEGQHQLCAEGAALLGDYRVALCRAFPRDKAAKEQFGVGTPLSPKSSKSVHSGLVRFVTGAEAAPEKAAAVHLSAEDLARMKELRDEIAAGKTRQAEMATNAKTSTLARQTLQREIEEAMTKVVSAASIIYRKQPELVALFESTLPRRRSARRSASSASTSGPKTGPA